MGEKMQFPFENIEIENNEQLLGIAAEGERISQEHIFLCKTLPSSGNFSCYS